MYLIQVYNTDRTKDYELTTNDQEELISYIFEALEDNKGVYLEQNKGI